MGSFTAPANSTHPVQFSWFNGTEPVDVSYSGGLKMFPVTSSNLVISHTGSFLLQTVSAQKSKFTNTERCPVGIPFDGRLNGSLLVCTLLLLGVAVTWCQNELLTFFYDQSSLWLDDI